ncbi:transketolase [Zhaonella formicivorans]|uniref:transketolase n=1 Tax=Zhaonella formicivorans TaxID=2528593 RepID=UPI0010D0B21B|nr:transketolase [Zhaonella formicivorans]
MSPQSVEKLKEICKDVRADIVRMTAEAGSGHPGGSLSSVELMTALYFNVLKHRPEDPSWPDRDRFILSKGHVCPVLYSVMARTGYFPVEELLTLRKLGSRLQGHPSYKALPGLESSSGSLGQGLSIANGLALAAKLNGKDYRVYCLMGDGELQEGQIWEAMMTAPHYKLDNVCAIVDYNNLQIDGKVEEVMGIAPLAKKWEDFNWHVIEIDGHDLNQVLAAYEEAKQCKGKPSVIIANTVKGKGVSFMENVAGWHGKAPNREELEKALAEIYGREN